MTVRRMLVPTIFALLLSLVISSGEGVRLFPIPVADGAVSSNSEALSSSTLQSYQYATRMSGSSSKQSNATSYKGKHGSGAVVSTARSTELNVSATFLLSSSFDHLEVREDAGFRNSNHSRGPPTC